MSQITDASPLRLLSRPYRIGTLSLFTCACRCDRVGSPDTVVGHPGTLPDVPSPWLDRLKRVPSMRKKTNGAQSAGQNITRSEVPHGPVRFQDRTKSQQRADAPVGTMHAASRATKSLMKTSDLATRGGLPARPGAKPFRPTTAVSARHGKSSVPAHHPGRKQKVEERIAAASEQLIAGITEAASASEELRRAMEQISTGAEEAASASQETFCSRYDYGYDFSRRHATARN